MLGVHNIVKVREENNGAESDEPRCHTVMQNPFSSASATVRNLMGGTEGTGQIFLLSPSARWNHSLRKTKQQRPVPHVLGGEEDVDTMDATV